MVVDSLGSAVAVVSKGHLHVDGLSEESFANIVGRGRVFENDRGKIGQITSVRVNKGGNRISILARPLPAPGVGLGGTGGASSLPDTNIYVYDTDSDSFLLHDCGELGAD